MKTWLAVWPGDRGRPRRVRAAFGFVLEDGRFTGLRFPGSTLTVPWFIDDRGGISGTYSASADPLFNGEFHGFVAMRRTR